MQDIFAASASGAPSAIVTSFSRAAGNNLFALSPSRSSSEWRSIVSSHRGWILCACLIAGSSVCVIVPLNRCSDAEWTRDLLVGIEFQAVVKARDIPDGDRGVEVAASSLEPQGFL